MGKKKNNVRTNLKNIQRTSVGQSNPQPLKQATNLVKPTTTTTVVIPPYPDPLELEPEPVGSTVFTPEARTFVETPVVNTKTEKPAEIYNIPKKVKKSKLEILETKRRYRWLKPTVTETDHQPIKLNILESTNQNNMAPMKYRAGPNNPAIKLNMLESSNQNTVPPIKYRAGIPRSFYASEVSHMNRPGQAEPAPSTSMPVNPAPATVQQFAVQQFENEPTRSQSQDKQRYSPSDAYRGTHGEKRDGSESPDFTDKGYGKRPSAFERLGPRDEPKKPKLTINLMCIRDQSVREVVDETTKEDRFLPVHLRKDVIESTDEIVIKYLPLWPWKKNISNLGIKTYSNKYLLVRPEPEIMDEFSKSNSFFQIEIKGYPAKWRKEDVLDVLLENVRGKSFIPCFIEFTPKECKLLVIRCAHALLQIHNHGYSLRTSTVEMQVTISSILLSINHLDFIPRLVLRKLLAQGYDDERKLTLKAFTLKPDISHFIYFPLNREQNQIELFQMLNVVAWDYLTDLDLSHNKLKFLDGFDLPNAVPKLKNLDLSYNCFDKITPLLPLRTLSLNTIKLEGNPLCYNYTDPAYYVRVLRMLFPSLKYIDDLPILLKGEFPPNKQNYSPESATLLVDKFLEIFFPLLEGSLEDKTRIADMYDKKAVLTVTMANELRTSKIYRIFHNLFSGVRLNDFKTEAIEGSSAIASVISKWPPLQHDPLTFTVDVMHHNDTSTILRISGVLKITAHTLAEDEYHLAFTRSLVLTSKNGVHYKIQNELLYWEPPAKEMLAMAFRVNTVKARPVNLKIDSLDQETKENLIAIFMTITDLDKKSSERCLGLKEWNMKLALEHFVKLLKLDDIQSLSV